MDKMKYIKPNLRVVDMSSEAHVLDASMAISTTRQTDEVWTKGEKDVWDDVWNREPVFDANKGKNQ